MITHRGGVDFSDEVLFALSLGGWEGLDQMKKLAVVTSRSRRRDHVYTWEKLQIPWGSGIWGEGPKKSRSAYGRKLCIPGKEFVHRPV